MTHSTGVQEKGFHFGSTSTNGDMSLVEPTQSKSILNSRRLKCIKDGLNEKKTEKVQSHTPNYDIRSFVVSKKSLFI